MILLLCYLTEIINCCWTKHLNSERWKYSYGNDFYNTIIGGLPARLIMPDPKNCWVNLAIAHSYFNESEKLNQYKIGMAKTTEIFPYGIYSITLFSINPAFMCNNSPLPPVVNEVGLRKKNLEGKLEIVND